MLMSKRLQVVLDDREFGDLQRIARKNRVSVSEWVRTALRSARKQEPTVAPDRKLAVLRAAVRHEFPTAEMGQMLAEIEQGYMPERDP